VRVCADAESKGTLEVMDLATHALEDMHIKVRIFFFFITLKPRVE